MDVVIVPSAFGIATTACRGLPALPNLGSWEVSTSGWNRVLSVNLWEKVPAEMRKERRKDEL